mmetsp:Transcript_27126/g.89060  ORF Transcript_27126/g.89060 Transcript_27126/m.89060 type:complete len:257 (+) Transcript_27126:105-875(+)
MDPAASAQAAPRIRASRVPRRDPRREPPLGAARSARCERRPAAGDPRVPSEPGRPRGELRLVRLLVHAAGQAKSDREGRFQEDAAECQFALPRLLRPHPAGALLPLPLLDPVRGVVQHAVGHRRRPRAGARRGAALHRRPHPPGHGGHGVRAHHDVGEPQRGRGDRDAREPRRDRHQPVRQGVAAVQAARARLAGAGGRGPVRTRGRRPHRGRDRATQPRLNPSQSPEAPGGKHPDSYTVPLVETQEAIHACMRAA